jgi:hypothetical protein
VLGNLLRSTTSQGSDDVAAANLWPARSESLEVTVRGEAHGAANSKRVRYVKLAVFVDHVASRDPEGELTA